MVGGTGRVFVVRNNRAYTLHCLLFELPQDGQIFFVIGDVLNVRVGLFVAAKGPEALVLDRTFDVLNLIGEKFVQPDSDHFCIYTHNFMLLFKNRLEWLRIGHKGCAEIFGEIAVSFGIEDDISGVTAITRDMCIFAAGKLRILRGDGFVALF